MKKQSRKLSLDRETLLSMTAPQLAGVNGGTSPATTVTTSSAICIEGASVVSAASITTVSMAVCQTRWCGNK